MRVIAVSDIHLNKEAVSLLKERLKGKIMDAVIVTGDITTHGSSVAAEEIIKELKQIARIIAVPGNMDTKEVNETLENKGLSIHNQSLLVGEYRFTGFGGSLKGDAGHIHFTEKQIESSLEKLLAGDCSKTVLVTHLPPFGTSLDTTPSGKHIGSKAVLKIVEKKQPLLHLCGHAHESLGEEIFGRTLSINIGALKNGKAAIIDFNGKIKIERIDLFAE